MHDAALREDRAFVAAVAACAVTAIERQRLRTTVNASLRELEESRARLLADVDHERRRIERDLHDGAQQRLVVLRIKLALVEEATVGGGELRPALLRALGAQVEEIIDELRSVARGVYPSLLADRGLSEALRSAALRAPLPTHVASDAVGRYHKDIETAVYFTCLEAMQNVAKHAPAASRVDISLRENGALCFEIRDDGPGFADAVADGAGLTNMRDRVAAVGGMLSVHSSPGHGTRVSGTVPAEHRDA